MSEILKINKSYAKSFVPNFYILICILYTVYSNTCTTYPNNNKKKQSNSPKKHFTQYSQNTLLNSFYKGKKPRHLNL